MSKSRNVCERPPISQGIKPGGKSICWSCIHWAVCFAKKTQPCVRCSRYSPSADVVEVRYGEWEIHAYGLDGEDVYCSVCGNGSNLPYWHYCPNCGAKMDDAQEGE